LNSSHTSELTKSRKDAVVIGKIKTREPKTLFAQAIDNYSRMNMAAKTKNLFIGFA
jgi:hypothetical protein